MAVHPHHNYPACTVSDHVFNEALLIVRGSDAEELIGSWRGERRQGQGGRPRLPFTVAAFIAALACCMLLGLPRTIAQVFRCLSDFTPEQLETVGMREDSFADLHANYKKGLASFRTWLETVFACVDPAPEQPLRREDVVVTRSRTKALTPAQRAANELAEQRLTELSNAIVVAPIDRTLLEGARGDLVVDGTKVELAGHTYGLGNHPGKQRGAAHYGALQAIESNSRVDSQGKKIITDSGWRLEVTAVSAIGPADALHSTPTVFTGIAVHRPSSGSFDGLDTAVRFHRANGFDQRKTGNARLPMITWDKGYTDDRMGQWQVDNGYAGVFRYSERWTDRVLVAVGTRPGEDELPGPVQVDGVWFCPMVSRLTEGRPEVSPLRVFRDPENPELYDQWEAHDTWLKEYLPLAMGVNRRAWIANAKAGRPSTIAPPARAVKMELSCPASLGNVRCTRWHNPATEGRVDLAELAPGPDVPDYRCCRRKSVTVTLTEKQVRLHQHSQFIPLSWDHAIYFEAARSLTEQRFNIVKSRAVAGLDNLKIGPRREALVRIIIAMAFAVANLREIQRFREVGPARGESIERKWARLREDLNREPARTPPRT